MFVVAIIMLSEAHNEALCGIFQTRNVARLRQYLSEPSIDIHAPVSSLFDEEPISMLTAIAIFGTQEMLELALEMHGCEANREPHLYYTIMMQNRYDQFLFLLQNKQYNTLDCRSSIVYSAVWHADERYLKALLSEWRVRGMGIALLEHVASNNTKTPKANIQVLLEHVHQYGEPVPDTLFWLVVKYGRTATLEVLLEDERLDPTYNENAALHLARELNLADKRALLEKDLRVQAMELSMMDIY